MIIDKEVNSVIDLKGYYDFNNNFHTKVCVVCFLFDKDGNLILHRRGAMARDEVNKLEAIGGSINKDDKSFKDSALREIREEAGDKAVVEIKEFIGGQVDTKFDKNANETINWIILAYKGLLIDGELINMEPERCIGFEIGSLDSFKKEDMSETCYNFIEKLKKMV